MFKKKKKDAPSEAAEGEAAAAAATTAEGEAAEGDAPKKKGKKKLILIAAGALVVMGGGGATAFIMLGPKADKADAHGEKGEHGDKKKDGHKKAKKKGGGDHGGGGGKAAPGAAVIAEGPDGVVYYTMPDLVVNIQSPDGRPTYLKLKLTLELPDHESAEALSAATPRLNDMFTTFLRELRPEDLSGSQGTYQLRMEILRRVNLVAAPAEANAVLIEEMLIQG
ncbi:MAG TPA: flagellar basal body-associated FliL family protein [Caulobacteraceae bacterium]